METRLIHISVEDEQGWDEQVFFCEEKDDQDPVSDFIPHDGRAWEVLYDGKVEINFKGPRKNYFSFPFNHTLIKEN